MRIPVKVTKNEHNDLLLNGKKDFSFEAGVSYHLTSDFDICVTWDDKTNNSDILISDPVSAIRLQNIAHPEQHRAYRNLDKNSIYKLVHTPVYLIEDSEIGLIDKRVGVDHINDIYDQTIGESLQNNTINTRFQYYWDKQVETQLGVDPEIWKASDYEDRIFHANDTRSFDWTAHSRHIAVFNDGVRVNPKSYSIHWSNNNGTLFPYTLTFDTQIQGPVILKTDLVSFAVSNGTKSVVLRMPIDDQRTVIVNNPERSYNDYKIKTHLANENKAFVFDLFDDYLLAKYPKIYEVLRDYVRFMSMRGESFGYLRNLDKYSLSESADDNVLADMLHLLFPVSDNLAADQRKLYPILIEYYKNKGTVDSFKFLTRILLNKDFELERAYQQFYQLSESEWSYYHVLYTKSTDLLDKSDVGKIITGQKSNAFGVVENVENWDVNRTNITKTYITMIGGNFNRHEQLKIEDRIVNLTSYEDNEVGIVGYDIVNPGYGYNIGDKIVSDSTTGFGFEACVNSIDNDGGVLSIDIKDHGWFYRDYQFVNIYVEEIPYTSDKEIQTVSEFPVSETLYQCGDVLARKINTWEFDVLYPDGTIRYNTNHTSIGYNLTKIFINDIEYVVMLNYYGFEFFDKTGASKIIQFDHVDITKVRSISSRNNDLIIAYTDRIMQISERDIELADMSVDSSVAGETIFNHPYINIRSVHAINNGMLISDNLNTYLYDINMNLVYTIAGAYNVKIIKEHSINGIHTLEINNGFKKYILQNVITDHFTAKIIPKFGLVSKQLSAFRSAGFNTLSSNSVITENDKYQPYSIGYRIQSDTQTYMHTFNEIATPAGHKAFGIYTSYASNFDDNANIDTVINDSVVTPPIDPNPNNLIPPVAYAVINTGQ